MRPIEVPPRPPGGGWGIARQALVPSQGSRDTMESPEGGRGIGRLSELLTSFGVSVLWQQAGTSRHSLQGNI